MNSDCVVMLLHCVVKLGALCWPAKPPTLTPTSSPSSQSLTLLATLFDADTDASLSAILGCYEDMQHACITQRSQ